MCHLFDGSTRRSQMAVGNESRGVQ